MTRNVAAKADAEVQIQPHVAAKTVLIAARTQHN